MDVDLASLIPTVDLDPQQALKYFHRALECETARPQGAFSDGLTMSGLHARQFEWLLELAQDRQPQLGGELPETVAIYWARQKGVATKAIAKVLGIPNRAVSDALYQLRGRLRSNPGLQAILMPP